jgi:hypothetical protein
MRVRICLNRAAEPPGCLLPFPATTDSRIAQVGEFPILPGPPLFYVGCWEALRAFQPDILAGHCEALIRLADLVTRQRIDLALRRALFALTRVGDRPLPDADRDQLWHAFGVPVYELYVSCNGIILAGECEAHTGWHVNPETARTSKLRGEPHLVLNRRSGEGREFQAMGMGFSADVTTAVCECGQSTPRVINLPVCSDPVMPRLAAASHFNYLLAPPAA